MFTPKQRMLGYRLSWSFKNVLLHGLLAADFAHTTVSCAISKFVDSADTRSKLGTRWTA